MKTTHQPTRGERNNNPLNIRWDVNTHWIGQIYHDPQGYCTFKSVVYGIRAAFAILRTYKFKHHLTTIEEIISRWAPPSENNTEKYIDDVAYMMRVDRTTEIDYRGATGRELVRCMAIIESKMQLPPEKIKYAQSMIL